MLVMEDRRKEVKAILCEELDNLRQRIIENHIRAGQRASCLLYTSPSPRD